MTKEDKQDPKFGKPEACLWKILLVISGIKLYVENSALTNIKMEVSLVRNIFGYVLKSYNSYMKETW